MVNSSVTTLRNSLGVLRNLRDACAESRPDFVSRGFLQFFDTLDRDLTVWGGVPIVPFSEQIPCKQGFLQGKQQVRAP